MAVSAEFQAQVLRRRNPKEIPPPGALAAMLNRRMATSHPSLARHEAEWFVTASVEMWHRSIHSLIVSICHGESSPLWSSVAGYYSSHYIMRALAHFNGYFVLARRRTPVEASLAQGGIALAAIAKTSSREHEFYWNIANRYYGTSALFAKSKNEEESHRAYANYEDHIHQFVRYEQRNVEFIARRIKALSTLAVPASVGVYPSVADVQALALHRIHFYRTMLDALVGEKSKYWKLNRAPAWDIGVTAVQIESDGGVDSEV